MVLRHILYVGNFFLRFSSGTLDWATTVPPLWLTGSPTLRNQRKFMSSTHLGSPSRLWMMRMRARQVTLLINNKLNVNLYFCVFLFRSIFLLAVSTYTHILTPHDLMINYKLFTCGDLNLCNKRRYKCSLG